MFCLRWNDFESNISSYISELHNDKDFFDGTLACDDEQIQAHKLIISAFSPFFRNVFRRVPTGEPITLLEGCEVTDPQAVFNFMYHGKVSVAQEDLNSFLAVAEDLYSVHKTKLVQVPNIWVRSVEVVGAASSGSGGSKRKL